MSVITISRGSFSGGKMLAECVAKKLGYRCVDRDVVVERAAASSVGVTQQELREALTKPPGLLERFKHKRYIYLTLLQAALTEEVRSGKAIYHGLAGHLLLKAGPHLLRVRIIAPIEFRIRMVQKRLKYGESEATAYIERMDEERRRWTQYLYGVDWRDPSLYDLVVNLEQLTVDLACNMICTLTLDRCFEFSPKCQQAMDNLVLASRVRAALAMDKATSDLEVDTVAARGTVKIAGKLLRISQLQDVQRVAQAIPGVEVLDVDELALPARAL